MGQGNVSETEKETVRISQTSGINGITTGNRITRFQELISHQRKTVRAGTQSFLCQKTICSRLPIPNRVGFMLERKPSYCIQGFHLKRSNFLKYPHRYCHRQRSRQQTHTSMTREGFMLSRLFAEEKNRTHGHVLPSLSAHKARNRGSSPVASRHSSSKSLPLILSSSWTTGPVFTLPLNSLPTAEHRSRPAPVQPPTPHVYISFPPHPDDEFDLESQRHRSNPTNRNLLPDWMVIPNRWLNSIQDYIRDCALHWGPAPKDPRP